MGSEAAQSPSAVVQSYAREIWVQDICSRAQARPAQPGTASPISLIKENASSSSYGRQ